ncbi:MAG TPA: trigger factor [Acidimicrobiales bacterium]|nr:trigger factor [Acidimicrobiales bacterium]
MQATAETLEGNRVKLSIHLGADEFSEVIESALSEVASTINLPGFRPGHVPKRLVQARLGKETLREEALRDAMPTYIRQAVTETGTDAIGTENVEITSEPDDPELKFDAIVEIRPKPTIAGYAGLRVTVPAPEPTAQEIDAQVDRMRDQYGELKEVSRPAADGDHVTIDIKVYRNSEVLDELTTDDFLYEVGSASVVPQLDEQLRSAKVGEIFKVNADHPVTGEEVSFQVLVKEVKEKILPEANDEWASESSEFSTLDELRADISRQISAVKKVQAKFALRSGAARELAALVTDEVPNSLVAEEIQIRLSDLQHRLEHQGANVQQYLRATGQDAETFTQGLTSAAQDTVRLDLALRSLAEAESIVADEAEVAERIQLLAERSGDDPEVVRSRLEESAGMEAVRWEIRKSKALTWLEDNIEVVDEEGKSVDRALLQSEDSDTGTLESARETARPEG